MHVRLNFVDMKPDQFDEIDRFWRDTVNPYAGLVRGLFLRRGDTVHTLSVVVFETEESMRDNTTGQLSDIVKQAASHRLTEPELHHAEVLATVEATARTGPGVARIVRAEVPGGTGEPLVRAWSGHVSAYREEPGFAGAWLFHEAGTGLVWSLTLWDGAPSRERNEQVGAFGASGASGASGGDGLVAPATPAAREHWGVRVDLGSAAAS